MTEERKVQLGVAVDATGAKAGFDQVKQGARDMAQAVGQAGQVAGKGMDAVGEGAKRSADAMNREEGRMRSAIQRVTLDLQTLGKSASEKLEAKINLQGLDAAKFAPYLAALKQAEDAQRKLQTAGVAAQSAIATQAQAATAAVGGMDTALSRATTSLGAASFANLDRVGTSLGAAAAKADEAARAVQRLDKAIELTGPLATAGTSFGATTGPAAGGLRGAIERRAAEDAARGPDPRLAALGSSAAATAPYVAGLRAATAAQDGLGLSTKQLNFALRQVPAQMTDIVVSLQAGQRPLQVLLQQGGQLKDLFGGIGPAARALGTYALGLVNPFTVAAAAVGLLGVAMAQVESRARGLNTIQAQLAGTGRAGAFSDSGLKEFLAELALAPGVTRESATAIISELSKVHEIGGGLFRDLGRAAADYAKVTGTDVPTAAKALAKAFADPANGVKQLDAALGTISSTTILTVERLSKLGDVAGAQRVMADALKGSIKGLADSAMTPLQKSVNDLGNSWEGAMRKLDQSDGLRNLNILLGKTVDFVSFLVANADKIGGLGNIAVAAIPGVGAQAAVANAIRAPFTSAPAGRREVAGKVTDASAAATVASGAAASGGDAEVKRALEAAKSYRSQASELADLANERKRFNSALTESVTLYGKESEQAKRLRAAIAGVDEKAASVRKRGAGGGNEGQQVLDAQLQQSLKGTRDALEKERDDIAFSNRFLQGLFQAGEISMRDFYEEKRKAIEQGTAAQLQALEKERVDVQAHLDATRKTSPKDRSALVRDETRLKEIDADVDKLRIDGARQQVLANQEAGASFKQLDEQVLQYQASLKSLQGDEIGAARIRDELARKQLSVLATQSAGSSSPITQRDQEDFAAAQRQVSALNEAKTKTSVINQQLQIEEERIGLAMRTGTAGEIEALNQLGGARAKAVVELEKIVKAQEEVAKSRPQDYQLQIDTSRARLELDKLKADLDPLKEKFDNLFKDAGASFLEDLMGGKGLKGALRGFADNISREINSVVAKELSGQIFGKDGVFGGAGGFFAKLFGGKDASPGFDSTALPTGDFARMDRGQTGEKSIMDLFSGAGEGAAAMAAQTAATSTLTAAYTTGTTAFATMTEAAYSAAAALNSIQASGGGGTGGNLGSLFGGSSFGRMGETAPGGSSFGSDIGYDLPWSGSTGGYTGAKDPRKAVGIVHGDEYVFSSPAVRAIGVDRLERIHAKAKTGRMEDEEVPGYSDGGYVAVLGSLRPQTAQRGKVTPLGNGGGDTYVVQVSATPGVSREQAMNQGRDIQRGMQAQAGRRSRNS